MHRSTLATVLIATFAVVGAAHAQKAAETTNAPQRAGEASTMTGGVPNAKTTNEAGTTTDAAKGKAGKAEKATKAASATGSGKGGASATTNTPDRAGEASTMTQGVPNKKTTN